MNWRSPAIYYIDWRFLQLRRCSQACKNAIYYLSDI